MKSLILSIALSLAFLPALADTDAQSPAYQITVAVNRPSLGVLGFQIDDWTHKVDCVFGCSDAQGKIWRGDYIKSIAGMDFHKGLEVHGPIGCKCLVVFCHKGQWRQEVVSYTDVRKYARLSPAYDQLIDYLDSGRADGMFNP